MTQSIVGSWYIGNPGGGTDQIAFTFLADHTFLVADKGTPSRDPTGTSGIEWGTYSWDENTGALALTFGVNTDGEWGLSHSGITSATVSGDTITFNGGFAVPRLISPPGTIVGSWYNHDGQGGTDQIVFTFLPDGSLLVADKGTVARDPSGKSGLEWGSYTWDPATGATVINIQINTDGQWGFASAAPETIHMTLRPEADGLRVLVSDGDGGLLERLSPLAGITGTAGNDTLTGTATGEFITALGGNDMLTGGGGNDTMDGGAGIDFASYTGTHSGHTISKSATGFTVSDGGGSDGVDSLTAVERLHFADTNLALDLDGNAGNVARILGAVFGRGAIFNREFVGIGLDYMDSGMSYEALMQLALNYTLGGTSNHTAVVNLLWANVIGGTPPASDLATYVGMLDHGTTAGALGVMAAGTSFNENNINLTGLSQTGIEYT